MVSDGADKGEGSVDTFAQVNAALIDHGCMKKPLDVSEVPSSTKRALGDLLHSMIAQRQKDAEFREQLSSKLRVTESSLERTRRFWKEEQDRTTDLAGKWETTKARVGTTSLELSECQSSLKRTKEELQKSKRDLLAVKQQVHQQKQASERQLERLRTRFSDESIKSLRGQMPNVFIANSKAPLSSSSRSNAAAPWSLERKQVEELEVKRRELIEANAAMKRIATESLNLAREAGQYMERMESKESVALGSSTGSDSSRQRAPKSTLLYQRDLFPPLFPLQPDYSVGPTKGQRQHPAIQALHQASEMIHIKGPRLVESMSFQAVERQGGEGVGGGGGGEANNSNRTEQEQERERLLHRALQRVQELEREIERREEEMHVRRGDYEGRVKQTTEVEKQRQRYLALCRELEKQEELLRLERETLQREREEVLRMEMSQSVQEDSIVSSLDVGDSLKRQRESEKENESGDTESSTTAMAYKRHKTELAATPKEDTMRFVTVRKQRGRLQ